MIDFSAIIKPFSSKDECGDFYICQEYDDYFMISIGDIGGHGSYNVYKAALDIEQSILNNHNKELQDIMKIIHAHPSIKSRGMVLFLGKVYKTIPVLKYCQIGNIKAKLIRDGKITDLLEQDGVIGYTIPQNIKINVLKLIKNDLFIFGTDGVSMHNMAIKEHIHYNDNVSDISSMCMQMFQKENDDALCATLKYSFKGSFDANREANVYKPNESTTSQNTPHPAQPIKHKEIKHLESIITEHQVLYNQNIVFLGDDFLIATIDDEQTAKKNMQKILSVCDFDKTTKTKIITYIIEMLNVHFGGIKIFLNKYLMQIVAIITPNCMLKVEYIFCDYSFSKLQDGNILAVVQLKLNTQLAATQAQIDDIKEEIKLGIDSEGLARMKEARKNEQVLLEQSKLASMGEMIGNIAHQWRQPLSVISTISTGLKVQLEFGVADNETILKDLDVINQNAQYLSKTIDDFRSFIKNANAKEQYKLSDALGQVLSLVRPALSNHHITLVSKITQNAFLEGYPNELIQAIINIINNSRDAIIQNNRTEDKFIFLETVIEGKHILLKIQDNGGGIPQNIINKIFEPYFTTKHQSQGTGIGLYMTRQIITEHNDGDILVKNIVFEHENKSYKGAELTIILPIFDVAY